jgi:hypothetical protein
MQSLLKAFSLFVDAVTFVGCALIAYAVLTAVLVAIGVMEAGQPMFGGSHLAPELNVSIYYLILGAVLLSVTRIAQGRIKKLLAELSAAPRRPLPRAR